MKVVILAGGQGSRISEESLVKPKPLVEIGFKPIIWHIMKIYSYYGSNEFIICCGYKGYLIKEYFANYSLHTTDITVDVSNNKITVHKKKTEPWKITLVDTGDYSQTGERIKRIKKLECLLKIQLRYIYKYKIEHYSIYLINIERIVNISF